LLIPHISKGSVSKNYFLYFHGNAEDLGNCCSFLKELSYELKVNIVAMEYPGYGIYNTCQKSAD
jgi:hypothetical protein